MLYACPNCGKRTESRYCLDHQPRPWATSNRRAELPKDWEARRYVVLRRDPICMDGRVCNHMALSTEVDHKHDRHDHDPANLQGICKPCHQAKTIAERRRAA